MRALARLGRARAVVEGRGVKIFEIGDELVDASRRGRSTPRLRDVAPHFGAGSKSRVGSMVIDRSTRV